MSSKEPGDGGTRRSNRMRAAQSLGHALRPLLWPVVVGLVLALPILIPLVIPTLVGGAGFVTLSGVLFQVTGLGTVAIGLSRAREAFGERGLLCWLRHLGWLIRRVVSPPPSQGATLIAPLSESESHSYPPEVTANADSSIEGRIAALERRMRSTEQKIKSVQQSVSDARAEARRATREEARKRKLGTEKLRASMKEAVIGGIHIEATGVAYIGVGIFLTAFPGGVAGFLY